MGKLQQPMVTAAVHTLIMQLTLGGEWTWEHLFLWVKFVIVNRACGRECATYLTNFEIRIGKTYFFRMGETRRYRDCQLSILMTAG